MLKCTGEGEEWREEVSGSYAEDSRIISTGLSANKPRQRRNVPFPVNRTFGDIGE